jgi:ferritin-like metal-binding protein YciE
MSRLATAQERVIALHTKLQTEMQLSNLTALNHYHLDDLLEQIYRFERHCSLKNIRYSENACVAMRGAIADLMLLIDDFDLQATIANRDKPEDIHTQIGSVA